MATNDDIQIGVGLTGKASVEEMQQLFRGLQQQINETVSSAEKLDKALRRQGADISSGGRDAFLTNSAVTGMLNQFKASSNQAFARVFNGLFQGLQNEVRGFERRAAILFSQMSNSQFARALQQNIGDPGALASMQTAAQFRVAQGRAGLADGSVSNAEYERRVELLRLVEQSLDMIAQKEKDIADKARQTTQHKEKLAELDSRIRVAVDAAQKKEVLALHIKRQQVIVANELKNANGRVTEELRKQEMKLSALLQEQRKLNEATRARSSRGIAGEGGTDIFENSIMNRLRDGGAGLFAIQSQLQINYMIMGNITRLMGFMRQFVIDLDREFAQLQAITATTNTEMRDLEDALIAVSEQTKFTALEVARAATILGQAGFSTREIRESIMAITLLATATGSDLQTAVDLVSSTITVFNLQASEAGRVVNTFTSAINNSKLTMDRLALGMQYAGNLAAQSGATFSELTAILGAMANSGIRAGSMLGTGLRQLFIAFSAPTDELRQRIMALGLSVEDLNIRLHGFDGVMRNLQEAGFTAADAMQVLETRAGAAFAAIANNVGTISELQEIFLLTESATAANTTQMGALENKLARLTSVFGTVVARGFKPLLDIVKLGIDALSALFQVINQGGVAIPILTTAIASLIGTIVAGRLVALVSNLVTMFRAMAIEAAKTGAQVTVLGTTLRVFNATALGPFSLLVAGATMALSFFVSQAMGATSALDRAQAAFDEAEGRVSSYRDTLESINEELDRLVDRHVELNEEGADLRVVALELQQRFEDVGATFSTLDANVDTFINTLRELRTEMRNLEAASLEDALFAQQELLLQTMTNAQDRSLGRLQGFRGNNMYTLGNQVAALADGNSRGTNSSLAYEAAVNYVSLRDARLTTNLEDETALQQLIDQFQEAISQLTSDAIRGVDPNDQINGQDLMVIREAMIEQRNALRLLLGQYRREDQLNAQLNQSQFDRLPQVIEYESQVREIRSRLAELRANDGLFGSDLEGRRGREQAILSLEQEAEQLREQIRGEFGDDARLAVSELMQDLTDTLGSIGIAARTAQDEWLQSFERIDSLRASRYRAELRQLQDSVDTGSSLQRILEIEAEGVALMEQRRDAERDLLYNQLRSQGQITVDETGDVLTDEAALALENLTTRWAYDIEEFRDDMAALHEDFLDQNMEVVSPFRELRRVFDEGKDGIANAIRDIQRPLQAFAAMLEAMDLYSIRNNVSDIEREVAQRRQQEMQEQAISQRYQAQLEHEVRLAAQIDAIEAQIARQQALAAGEQTYIDRYNAEGLDTNRDEVERAEERRAQAERRIDEGQQLLVAVRDEYEQTIDEVGNLADTLASRDAALAQSNLSFTEQFASNLELYLESIGGLMSFTDRISNQMTGLFDTIKNSFSDAVTSIVTGTESIGEAFKNMATSILEAMLRIAVNELAVMFFQAITGSFSGSSQLGISGSSSSTIFSGRKDGGGIRGRDSVPTLLEPGEYVLRKSAVDLLGRESLDQFNAMGNRATSRGYQAVGGFSMPVSTPEGEKIVNVYVVAPNERPQMTKGDILVTIGEDVLKGGQTKQLIKRVALGDL